LIGVAKDKAGRPGDDEIDGFEGFDFASVGDGVGDEPSAPLNVAENKVATDLPN
jgi:hypothetical protein